MTCRLVCESDKSPIKDPVKAADRILVTFPFLHSIFMCFRCFKSLTNLFLRCAINRYCLTTSFMASVKVSDR